MQSSQNKSLVQFTATDPGSSFTMNTFQWLEQHTDYEADMVQACDYFKIIWITRGRGDSWIDLQKSAFESNQVIFIKSGQMHKLQPIAQLEGYIISFTESFLTAESHESDLTYHDSIFKMFIRAEVVKLDEAIADEMQDLVKKMTREFMSNNMFREEMLRRCLKILFIYLSRQIEGRLQVTYQTRNIELVEKFITLLNKHFRTEKMVSGYATLLSVTPNYLNEIVKKTTGHSAGHHIRQRVVFEAKRQATYSDTCMKQIGYYLGFDGMAHFSKFFKTATGMNFTDFKREKMVVSFAC